jgi:hypothetical protein
MAAAAEKLADGSRDCKLCISLSNKEELHPETSCMPCPKDFSIMQSFKRKALLKTNANAPTARWRIPMGNSGLLDAFLMIVATEGIQKSLMIHVLRLIGNTCADTGM